MHFFFRNKKRFLPYFLIAAAAIFGYWEISSLKFSLQWDMLDVHLPFLYYLSECLKAGEFPFWNPYQMLGYPFYADLQATPYYPPALLIAKIFGFNLYILHFYFLLHIFIAGAGMFRLCKILFIPQNISLLCGIAYALCGIFISNAQHLLIITSAAYISLALGQFIRLYHSPGFFNSLLFSLIIFLLVSGGYPFLTIIFFYLLLFLFLFLSSKMILEKRKEKNFKFSLFNLLSFSIVVLLSLPIIISVKEILPFVSRGEGISLENCLENSYTFRSFLYFLLPFSLVENSEFFGVDLAMANIYFGTIAFCFFMYSLTQKKTRTEYFFLVAGIFCLLVSFGQELPLRKILYNYFPGMNYFRFPALFRIFSVLFFLPVAAFGMNKFSNVLNEKKKKTMLLIIVSAAIYFVSHIVVAVGNSESSFAEVKTHVLLQSTLQLIFLFVLAWLVFRVKNKKFSTAIFILLITDIFIAAQLNMNYTVVEPQLNPSEIQNAIDMQPNGFPIPQRKNLAESFDERIGAPGIWRNVNIFSKEPSADAFSSFWLNNYVLLMEENQMLAKEILKNSPVYVSSEIFPESRLGEKISDSSITSKIIFVNDEVFDSLKNNPFVSSLKDTCYFEKFGPNEFAVKTKTSGSQILTLLQNNYKGWQVSVDEKSIPFFTSNFMFVSTVVPPGEHLVKFKFENAEVFAAFIFSFVFFFVVLAILFFLKFRTFHLQNKQFQTS